MKKFKKLFISLLAVTVIGTSFVACSSPATDNGVTTTPETSGIVINEGATLENIVNQINEEIGIQMPAPVDETILTDMFYLNGDVVEEYYGLMAMTMTSSDNVVAVKATPGKIEEVTTALEKRKEDVVNSFAQYLPDQYEKAQAGKVIVKGDYAFLIIIGDYEKGLDNEMAKAEEILNSYFK